jgi:multidrug efflux pump subunit AcrA (membrane-fusion protein)
MMPRLDAFSPAGPVHQGNGDQGIGQTIRDAVQEATQEASQEAAQAARDAAREVAQAKREAQQQVREAQQQVREAQQQVREAQQQVRDARTADQRGAAGQALFGAQQALQGAEAALRATEQQARSAPVVWTSQPPFERPEIPPQAVDIAIGFFITCAVIIVGWPISRALGRRFERRGAPPAIEAGMTDQLQRIEQAVEAIAIEVERISESQRFLAKLQEKSPSAIE